VLLAIAVHVELFDAFDCKFLVLQRDLVGVGGESVSVTDDVVGKCGREKYDLDGLGK